MNISQTIDDLPAKDVRRRIVIKWAEDNAATLAAYNLCIRERGLWNEDLRKMRGQI